MNFQTPLSSIKGVGAKTSKQFETSGLKTVSDLLYFFPRKHEDFSQIVHIKDISPGKRTIRARCLAVSTRSVRRGMKITTATLSDGSGKLQAIWFNQAYRAVQLKDSTKEFYFSGDFEFNYNKYQLTNPSAELISDLPVNTDRILPIYRAVKGLKSQVVRKTLNELKPFITMVPESLPKEVVKGQKLLSLSDALLAIHFPKSPLDVEKARERFAFEELFELLLAAQLNKIENTKLIAHSIVFKQSVIKSFVADLPFSLTPGQKIATWDILKDISESTPMNRLLQGDVGAGKTVVAAIAIRQAASNGFQSALLAPTEILAAQHAETLSKLLSPHDINVALLSGSVKSKARQPLLTKLAEGEIDLIVGTHALLEPPVKFKSLALAVIDEQHRFGVDQRQKLLDKADKMPHLLAMTATPIPRSLALTLYGELSVSVISDKPKNRLPILTKIISPVSRKSLYSEIDSEISRGRQAYVVCRLIDDSPINEVKSVELEYKKLKNSVFGHRKIGLLHGRMKSAEKDAVMQSFKNGEIDILVCTTVVEVGVDVPNASVMMIEDADLYGLSQLHQLRGRVGRSEHQSYCYLLMSDTKKPSDRLKEIEKSNDGFYLAEVDLRLRGPGEIYGKAQHGALNLQMASLSDTALIARAQQAAIELAKSANLVQYKQLSSRVEYYQRLTTLN